MDGKEIFLLALALAMDAFAVSVTNGMLLQKKRLPAMALFGLFFGTFQMGMAILGFFGGFSFNKYIEAYDQWVAFGLLAFIGGKMIWESLKDDRECPKSSSEILRLQNMCVLAFATSIDAFAVGISFSLFEINIGFASGVIGLVAFILSAFGVYMGARLGKIFFLQLYAERIGGAVLICIGLKIVLENYHVFPF